MKRLRMSPVMALVVVVSCTPAKLRNDSVHDRIALIRDVRSSDGAALRAIKELRKLPAHDVPSKLWSDIANSDAYSDARRRWAVLQIFDRYVVAGSTLGDLAALLDSPRWLKANGVYDANHQSFIPVDPVPGGTARWIVIRSPDTGVCIAFSNKIGLTEIYDALMRKDTAAKVVIHDVGIIVDEESDSDVITWIERKMGSRYPRIERYYPSTTKQKQERP